MDIRAPSATAKGDRRAISPIIATIIVIVITVVAGAFLYTYATGMMRSGAASQVANIQSISLVVPSGTGAGTLTATISNAGTVTIDSINLTSFNGQQVNEAFIQSPIAPGQSASGTYEVSSGLVAGQGYEVQFTIAYANGQTQTLTTSVAATEYG